LAPPPPRLCCASRCSQARSRFPHREGEDQIVHFHSHFQWDGVLSPSRAIVDVANDRPCDLTTLPHRLDQAAALRQIHGRFYELDTPSAHATVPARSSPLCSRLPKRSDSFYLGAVQATPSGRNRCQSSYPLTRPVRRLLRCTTGC
jgi:hypothetical protein